MSKLLILGLLAILFVQACVGGTGANVIANTGITINDFSADPAQVLVGDTVLFQLDIENTGGTTARNVRVELFGVENSWKDASGDLSEDTQPKEFGTMKPPIAERNLPGDVRFAQWILMTPQIPQGVRTSLPIEARVTFDYNTSGFMQITAVSEDEFQRLRIQGATPDLPFVTNSVGPLQMQVPTADRGYIVVGAGDENDEFEYPLRITLTNVGSGFPVTQELDGEAFIGAGGRLSGTINLYGPGVEFADCLGEEGGTEIDLDDTEILLRVRSNQRADIACSIKFDTTQWQDRPTDKIIMVFNIFYTYYERKTTTVDVIG